MCISFKRERTTLFTQSPKTVSFLYCQKQKMMDEYALIVCPGKYMLGHHKLYEIMS